MDPIEQLYNKSVQRVKQVRPVMTCGLTPMCDGRMKPRHSVIGEGDGNEPYKVDEQVKCTNCLTTQKHGIGIDRKQYELEMEVRRQVEKADNPRIINYVTHWPDDEVQERLEALGYKEA